MDSPVCTCPLAHSALNSLFTSKAFHSPGGHVVKDVSKIVTHERLKCLDANVLRMIDVYYDVWPTQGHCCAQ